MKKSLGKNILFVIALLVSFVLIAVSCPNNTIQGSVEHDGRNNAKIMITGTINAPLTDSRKFTVTLNNATFRAYSRGEDVSSWFVDENGEPYTIPGLKYRIATPVARGSNKATVRITGTPTEASKNQIHLLIPCDTFQGPININVDTQDTLFYNIIDYIEPTLVLVQEEGNDMLIEAMEGKPFDKTIKFALEHAYFAGNLSKTSIDVTTDGGDGSIINASSGGGKLDPSTTNPFTYTWKIGDAKEGEEHPTEILLNIKGTADKKRNAENRDTFTVTLLPSYYTEEDSGNEVLATIYDDFGNPYTKALSIKGTGEYRFTELKPTLKFVDIAPSFIGVADDNYADAFKEQSVTFRIYDGKLGNDSYNIYGTPKVEGDADTALKVANFFTDEYIEEGLDFTIARTSGSSSTPSGTDEFGSYFEYKLTAKKTTSSSRKLTVFEKELPLQFNVGHIKKYINNYVGSDYDEVLASDKNISFAISKNQPVFTKKAFIQGMAEVALETQTATLTIDNAYFFKATDTEEKSIDENSLVKISPMKEALVYSYKIEADASTPKKSKSIQIIVKQGTKMEDPGTADEDLLTVHAAEITVPAKSTSNPVSYDDSVFKQDKLDLAQIEVTFDPSLFETENGADLDADITSVVVKKGSNVLRYAIYPLDLSFGMLSIGDLVDSNGTRYEDSNLINTVNDEYSVRDQTVNRDYGFYPLTAGVKPPTFNKLKKAYPQNDSSTSNAEAHMKYKEKISSYAYDYYNILIKGEQGTSGYMTIYDGGGKDINEAVLDADVPYFTLSTYKRYKSNSTFNNFYSLDRGLWGKAFPSSKEGHLVPKEFTIPILLPKGYDLATDFDADKDIIIYEALRPFVGHTENSSDFLSIVRDSNYSKVIDVANKYIKFGLKKTDLGAKNNTTIWDPTKGYYKIKDSEFDDGAKNTNYNVYILYIREFPDTPEKKDAFVSELKNVGIEDHLDLYAMDIRLNPSKIINKNNNLYLSVKKSRDKSNWFRPVAKGMDPRPGSTDYYDLKDDNLFVQATAIYYHSGASFRIALDDDYNKYYWRIMDRATYAPITADLPDLTTSDRYGANFYFNLMHSVTSLSSNASLTTTASGTSPLEYGKDVGNTAGSYLNSKSDPWNVRKINPKTGTLFAPVPFPIGGVPIFELASGNTQTIPESTLNAVFSLKRKGYLPAGLAKGMNNHIFDDKYRKPQYIEQSLSDTIIYKGYTEYLDESGNPIIEDYSVDNLKGHDLTLPTYEASRFRNFKKVDVSSPGAVNQFDNRVYADWNNTTYLYLVWKKNPQSAYYNVWTSGKEHLQKVRFKCQLVMSTLLQFQVI